MKRIEAIVNGVNVSLRDMCLLKQVSDFMSYTGSLYLNNVYVGQVVNYGEGDDAEIHLQFAKELMDDNTKSNWDLVCGELSKYIYCDVSGIKIYFDIYVFMDVMAWNGLICGNSEFEIKKYEYKTI